MLSRARVFTSLFFSKGASRTLSSDENFKQSPNLPSNGDAPVYPCSFETSPSERQEDFEDRCQEEKIRDDEGRRKAVTAYSR